jgi:hypothetical protein
MTRSLRQLGALLFGALLLVGCTTESFKLPTVAAVGCRGIGLSGTLTGDPKDPRVAWLVYDGQRRDVVFPSGYTARFDPQLEILDGSGQIVGRAGDQVTGGCVTGPDANGPPLIVPRPTPTADSRPCAAVSAALTAALPSLQADVAAMVGGATDAATRSQLAADASRTLELLDGRSECYADATLTIWRADLDYLAQPWRPTFTHAEATRRLAEVQNTPLGGT